MNNVYFMFWLEVLEFFEEGSQKLFDTKNMVTENT